MLEFDACGGGCEVPICLGVIFIAVVFPGGDLVRALSREQNLAASRLEASAQVHATVAARHVRNASSRETRSVRRDVRWRWTLNVFWTAA